MEASPGTTSASLLLPSFAVQGEIDAEYSDEEVRQPARRWLGLQTLLEYARCFQEHKSGSLVSFTEWKQGEAHTSVRYRCAGCGLHWSPRLRR